MLGILSDDSFIVLNSYMWNCGFIFTHFSDINFLTPSPAPQNAIWFYFQLRQEWLSLGVKIILYILIHEGQEEQCI